AKERASAGVLGRRPGGSGGVPCARPAGPARARSCRSAFPTTPARVGRGPERAGHPPAPARPPHVAPVSREPQTALAPLAAPATAHRRRPLSPRAARGGPRPPAPRPPRGRPPPPAPPRPPPRVGPSA